MAKPRPKEKDEFIQALKEELEFKPWLLNFLSRALAVISSCLKIAQVQTSDSGWLMLH